jgi:peroxiredoxin
MIDSFLNGESQRDQMFLAEARATIVAGFDDETRSAYDQWIAWMKEVGIGREARRSGDQLPEFLLPDAHGCLISSAELLEHGPLIIGFILGDWCPFSCAELKFYERRMREIRRLGARLVAITPDTNGYPRGLVRKVGLENVNVLSDVDYGFSLACGLLYPVPAVGRADLSRHSVNLPQRHGTSAWMLPIPATYVVDRKGAIRLDHVDPDFTHRVEPNTVVAHLRDIV